MIDLRPVFTLLRSMGYIAKQNFMCCRNCAGHALANRITEQKDKDPNYNINGCVFYTQQDNYDKKNGNNFYLSYGQIDTVKYGTFGVSTKLVGDVVCAALQQFGVAYEWDGNPNNRIKILQLDKTNL